jgi:hypothetical protein
MGVAIIGAILAGMVRTQQAQQQQNLEKQLFEAQKKLGLIKVDDLTSQKNQLIQTKELYTTQIAAAKTKLAAPIDNIAAIDVILNSAHEYDLIISNINSNGKSNTTFAGNKFTALPFTFQVEGSTANIASFVSNINNLFPTSIVETYQLNIDIPTPAASPTTPEIKPTSALPDLDTAATINIIIFDYKGEDHVE